MRTVCLAAAVSVAFVGNVGAAEWNMATGYGDAFYHTGIVQRFIDDAQKSSGGSLKIKLHKNQSLVKLPDIKRAVQTEQVQMGEILLSQFGNEDPLYELDNVPFFADSFDEAQKLWKVLRPKIDASFAKRGMRVLYIAPWPTSGFYSNKPINSVADLKGVKIRVYNDVTRRFFELTGSQPTLVQFSEVPQAFATGLVDGMFTAPQLCLALKCWDFVKSFKHVGSHVPTNAVILNERAFKKLSPAEQNALIEAGKRADRYAWDTARGVINKQLATLKKNGMNVTEGSKAFVGELRVVGRKILDSWLAKAGESGKAVVAAYRN